MNNEFRFHPSAGAPPRPRPCASRRGPATSHDNGSAKMQVLCTPPHKLGNLWPEAGSKKQLHIVLECLPNEKIITRGNCSVGGPGPAPDKEGLAGVRRTRSVPVLPAPGARLSLFRLLNSQPSTPCLVGGWELKNIP